MSRKKKKQEKQERLAIKDFFDRILPGVLKFYSDHYICGDSYRCVWAIKEYPPSTEEQAILSQLADRTHVTLRIYNRLVDHAEQHRIIQNANRRNRLRFGGDDIQEMVDAEHNLKDVKQLLTNLRTNGETLLHTAVFIELKAADMDKLRELQSDVMMELTRCKISVDRLTLRQLDGFLSVLPFGYNHFGSQYGSNLNLGQMGHRCPDAQVAGKAELLGYRLLFRGRPGNAHATIEENEGRTVPALLWKVSVRDEALLDRYEGYPYYYDKVQIPVELGGKTVSAMAYVMQPGFDLNKPSPSYLHTIREGYQAAGFDQAVLNQALEDTRQEMAERQQWGQQFR